MPSSPSLQACRNMVSPLPSMCSLNRMPDAALARIISSVALRLSSGSGRIAIQFDQIEGVEENTLIVMAIADQIERSHAVVIAGNCLAIDDARARAQTGECFDDQREAMSKVIARAAIEPHPRAALAGDDAEAVVLDLVRPLAAGR